MQDLVPYELFGTGAGIEKLRAKGTRKPETAKVEMRQGEKTLREKNELKDRENAE